MPGEITLETYPDIGELETAAEDFIDLGQFLQASRALIEANILLEQRKNDLYSYLLHRSAIQRTLGLLTLRSFSNTLARGRTKEKTEYELVKVEHSLHKAFEDSTNVQGAIDLADDLEEQVNFIFSNEAKDMSRSEHGANITALGRLELFRFTINDDPDTLHLAVDQFLEARDLFIKDEDEYSPESTANNLFLTYALRLDPNYKKGESGIDPYSLWNDTTTGLYHGESLPRLLPDMVRFSSKLVSKAAVIRAIKKRP